MVTEAIVAEYAILKEEARTSTPTRPSGGRRERRPPAWFCFQLRAAREATEALDPGRTGLREHKV